ncbi:MAG: Ig-like domain-containing protein [Gemmatimonadota bacterium]
MSLQSGTLARRWILGLLFLATVSCTKDSAPVPIFTLAFPRAQDSVLIGSTVQVVATARDVNGNTLSGRRIQYSAQHTNVAEVDSAGNITGKAAATTTITATSEGKSTTLAINVLTPATRIIVAPVSSDLPIGTFRQLVATPVTAASAALSGRTVTWSSSNPNIATVQPGGQVIAVSVGTVTITAATELERIATGTAATGLATITVTDPVVSIRMTPNLPQIIRVGSTLQLSAQPLNAQQQPVMRPVTWLSNNNSIATVSQSGLVTGTALGQTIIVAESEGRQGTIQVTVQPVPVARVDLTPSDTVRVFVGGLFQFSFVARDSANNALSLQGRTVSWTSDNFPVVNVNAAGISQGISAGVGRISVTVDQVRSNETPVKVSLVPVSTVTVTPNGGQLAVGFVQQMTATLRDSNGNILGNRPITWAVSDTTLATITQAGVLRGVAQGNVTVSATAEGITGNAQIMIVP